MKRLTGNDIKKIRTNYNLTLQEFASKVGCSMNVVYLWEAGKRNPSKMTSSIIRKIFGWKENNEISYTG